MRSVSKSMSVLNEAISFFNIHELVSNSIQHISCFWSCFCCCCYIVVVHLSRRCNIKLLQLHFELGKCGPLCRIQFPSLTHHLVYFRRTTLGCFHFITDLHMFDHISQWLKNINETFQIIWSFSLLSLHIQFWDKEHVQKNKFPTAVCQSSTCPICWRNAETKRCQND